jgi:xanthine phosphoribosyltransferase
MSLTTNKMFYVSQSVSPRKFKELAKMCLAGEFDSIVAVSRGGLAAAILARELNIRRRQYLCSSSYDHDQQRELKILKDAALKDKPKLLDRAKI